jgi:hypothetical protein
MNVEEVKQLEADVSELVNAFQKATSFTVTRLNLEMAPITTKIKAEIRLGD